MQRSTPNCACWPLHLDERTALRAAADLAMSCGLDGEQAAVKRYHGGDYQ
jgi:hypothetical protein